MTKQQINQLRELIQERHRHELEALDVVERLISRVSGIDPLLAAADPVNAALGLVRIPRGSQPHAKFKARREVKPKRGKVRRQSKLLAPAPGEERAPNVGSGRGKWQRPNPLRDVLEAKARGKFTMNQAREWGEAAGMEFPNATACASKLCNGVAAGWLKRAGRGENGMEYELVNGKATVAPEISVPRAAAPAPTGKAPSRIDAAFAAAGLGKAK